MEEDIGPVKDELPDVKLCCGDVFKGLMVSDMLKYSGLVSEV